MIYVTLLPEWPHGSGIRQFWAGWYPVGSGIPSHTASGPCPFAALANVLERVAPFTSTAPRERGLFE